MPTLIGKFHIDGNVRLTVRRQGTWNIATVFYPAGVTRTFDVWGAAGVHRFDTLDDALAFFEGAYAKLEERGEL